MNPFEEPREPIRGIKRFGDEGGLNSRIYNVESWPGWLEKELITPEGISEEQDVRKYVEPGINFLENNFSKYLPPHKLVFKSSSAEKKTLALLYVQEVVPIQTAADYKLKSQCYNELADFLIQCCGAYKLSYDKNSHDGETPELLSKSLIFGKTIENEKPQLYLVDMYPTIKCKSDRFLELINSLIIQLGPEALQFLQKPLAEAKRITEEYI